MGGKAGERRRGDGEGEVLVEVDAAVGEFAEGSLLLELYVAGRRSAMVFLLIAQIAIECNLRAWKLCVMSTYQQPPRRSVRDECQPCRDHPRGRAVTGTESELT